MNCANVSGGCRMIWYSAPQASAQARAITTNALTNAFFTKLGFVLKVSAGKISHRLKCR